MPKSQRIEIHKVGNFARCPSSDTCPLVDCHSDKIMRDALMKDSWGGRVRQDVSLYTYLSAGEVNKCKIQNASVKGDGMVAGMLSDENMPVFFIPLWP